MSTFDFNFGDEKDESSTTGEKFSSFSFWENEDCGQSKFFNQDDDGAGVDFNMNVNINDQIKKPASKSSAFMSFDFGGNDDFSDCENSVSLERNKRADEHFGLEKVCDQKEDNERSSGSLKKDQWPNADFGVELEKKFKSKFDEVERADASFQKENSELPKSSIEGSFDYAGKRGTRGLETTGELQGFMSEFAADEELPKRHSNDINNQANRKSSSKVSTSLFDDDDFASFKEEKFDNVTTRLGQDHYNRKMPKCSFDNEDISVSYESCYATPLKIKKEVIESKETIQNEYLSPKMKTKSPMVPKRFLHDDKSPTNVEMKKRRVLFDEMRERRSGSPASVESNPAKQKTPRRENGSSMIFDQDVMSMKRKFDKQASLKSNSDSKLSMAIAASPSMEVVISYRNKVNAICDRRIKMLELREKFQNKLLGLSKYLLDASRMIERRQAEKHTRICQNIRKMLMDEME